MKAAEIHEHFMEIGTWVNWDDTVDGFRFGGPETEVTGIAVAWKPYWKSLKRALELGCNFFLGHESIFREGSKGDETSQAGPLEQEKLAWLQEKGMVVYRCHDVWDVMPRIGIRDSWATGLGFEGAPLVDAGPYRLDDVSGHTFESLCQLVADRARLVGHECVLAVGDPVQEVSRVGLGTGAITKLEKMVELGADVCVICDDYFRYVREGALYEDLGIPYIVVNHGAKEEWGMENLYEYAKQTFGDLPVHFIPQGCPYRLVGSPKK